jgi:hypothetical protein
MCGQLSVAILCRQTDCSNQISVEYYLDQCWRSPSGCPPCSEYKPYDITASPSQKSSQLCPTCITQQNNPPCLSDAQDPPTQYAQAAQALLRLPVVNEDRLENAACWFDAGGRRIAVSQRGGREGPNNRTRFIEGVLARWVQRG